MTPPPNPTTTNAIDKISPTDPRIQHKSIEINGLTYSYLFAEPKRVVGTVLLIHGFPDLALGWRYQIPLLLSLNLRVIAPNTVGYSKTNSPEELERYTFKSISSDLSLLLHFLSVSEVILGGHDWGGALVWRMALWWSKWLSEGKKDGVKVKGVFSICTPFTPPKDVLYRPAWGMPNFKYQEQFAGPEVESKISGPQKIREFLNVMYGGRTKSRKLAFVVGDGIQFEELEGVGKSRLLSEEEMDFYVKEYNRNGMRGPLNWYRTGELNHKDERVFVEGGKGLEGFEFPGLYVAGKRDAALPPGLSKGMERWWKDGGGKGEEEGGKGGLRRGEVDAGHWALWERPGEVNGILGEWLSGVLGVDGVEKVKGKL